MNSEVLIALQDELQTLNIPEPKARHTTIFDISGLSHHENTFSKWYQYFLDQNNKYSIIFIECLFNLLKKQKVSVAFPDNWQITREEKVEGKRIDLVLESEDNNLCLIIENKIWAKLYNNLETYSKYKKACTNPPIGIVLTLYKTSTNHDSFYNILHKDWLDLVKERINADESNDYYAFTNFYNAIINLHNDYTMNDQVCFFFENRTQILKASQTLLAAKKYIRSQLIDVSINQSLEISIARDKYFHYYLPNFKAACVVVAVHDLDGEFGGGANICLQLKKEGIKRKSEFDNDLKIAINEYDLEFEPWGSGTINYFHYAVKIYDSESPDFYTDIQKTVTEDLVNSFIPLLIKIKIILEKK